MDRTAIIHFAIAMFAILNPVGNVAIFAGLVAGRSHAEQRLIGLKSAIAALEMVDQNGGKTILSL